MVVSWASPGHGAQRWGEDVQRGERSPEEVAQLFRSLGMLRDPRAEASLNVARLVAKGQELVQLFVFRRRRETSADFATGRPEVAPWGGVEVAPSNAFSTCESEIMDVVDPLVPQAGSIWSSESCTLTLVQLQSFLFLLRSIYHASEHDLASELASFAGVWVWIKWTLRRDGLHGLIGRWDLGQILALLSQVLCEEKVEEGAAQFSSGPEISQVLELGVFSGLCEGRRQGLWREAQEMWQSHHTWRGWIRPKPFSFECVNQTQIARAPPGARLCGGAGSPRFLYRNVISSSSPWFAWRHLLLLEQVYFFRWSTVTDVVPWTY